MAFSLPTFAAGVSIPSCHYGRNLATKTNQKNTIMAPITQPDQLASSAFVSPSSLFLQRNGVTTPRLVAKRSAKVVAMAETSQVEGPVAAKWTVCKFVNNTSVPLISPEKNHEIWAGHKIKDFAVPAKEHHTITQNALDNASIAGVVLSQNVTNPEIKWIVAWSNKFGADNQVYVEIVDATANPDWKKLKLDLEKSGNEMKAHYRKYKSEVSIDLRSSEPNLKATLVKED